MIINGSRAGKKDISALVAAFNDRKIRMEKGGYLFKACCESGNLHIGAVPSFIEGQRMHHYDIEMPRKCREVLLGSLNGEGVFTLIFNPKNKNLTELQKEQYREVYVELASAFLKIGIKRPGSLDLPTVLILRSSGIIPEAAEPFTLEDIALYDKSTPRNS